MGDHDEFRVRSHSCAKEFGRKDAPRENAVAGTPVWEAVQLILYKALDKKRARARREVFSTPVNEHATLAEQGKRGRGTPENASATQISRHVRRRVRFSAVAPRAIAGVAERGQDCQVLGA